MKAKSGYKFILLGIITTFLSINPLFSQTSTGKVVFTSKDDATIINGSEKFGILDNIYVNIFLEEPLSHSYEQNDYTYDFENKRMFYNYALRIYENNELMGQWLYEMPPEYYDSLKKLHFPVATDREYEKSLYGNMVNSWVNMVRGLDDGKHEIRLAMVLLYPDIQGKNPPILAENSFTLNVDSDKLTTFIDKFKTELPEATILAPEIETQILNASDDVIEGAEPVEAIITDVTGDWGYSYDEFGNIMYRNIVASVVYRLRNGECWIKTGYYTQEHQGYGDFGVMTFARDAEGYSDYEIDCQLVEE